MPKQECVRGSRRRVYHGSCKSTSGGLKKDDIMRVKRGKSHRLISRRKHSLVTVNHPLKVWKRSLEKAAKMLDYKIEPFKKIPSYVKRDAMEIYRDAMAYHKLRKTKA